MALANSPIYTPTPIAVAMQSPDGQYLQKYLQQQLQNISIALQQTTAEVFVPLSAAPSRPTSGMVVYADGTNWNPGNGAGLYVYTGGSWVLGSVVFPPSQSLVTNASGKIVLPTRQSIGNQSPTGTTSTSARVMMGIGQSFTFTPNATGDFLVFMEGAGSNTITGSGFNARMVFGTGTAPANGDPLTGSSFGPISQGSMVSGGGQADAGITAYRTGFVVGTTYWLDVSLQALVSGTASLVVQFNVVEL